MMTRHEARADERGRFRPLCRSSGPTDRPSVQLAPSFGRRIDPAVLADDEVTVRGGAGHGRHNLWMVALTDDAQGAMAPLDAEIVDVGPRLRSRATRSTPIARPTRRGPRRQLALGAMPLGVMDPYERHRCQPLLDTEGAARDDQRAVLENSAPSWRARICAVAWLTSVHEASQMVIAAGARLVWSA